MNVVFPTKALCSLSALLPVLLALAAVSAAAKDYVIQPEDVLAIRVTGEPGLSRNYAVDEKGDIEMDPAGKIRMSGLTVKEAQQKLTESLSKYLKLFEVTLSVVGEIGNRVLVYGEVSRPGSTKIRMGDKLLNVLASVGPPTANADTKKISVTRKDTLKREMVDLDMIIKDPSLDIAIEPGDTITVPSKTTSTVRISGEVSRAGPVQLEVASTAYAAIMTAGPTANADFTRIALRKKDSSIPIIIDLSKVRSGQLKDDLQLQEGDQLTVQSKFAGTARVDGEVKAPGEKDLLGPVQLREFILSQGGGFTEQADQLRVQVLREGKPARTFDLLAVAKGLKRADDPELTVQPGDRIYVARGLAMVRGEVKTPGEFPLGNITNIWDFITMKAGGFTEKASKSKIEVASEDGKVKRIVDLQLVADGKKSFDDPELALLPGYVISVPNDESTRFSIVGAVMKGGTFPAKPGMRLLDAIAQAEGFSDKADKKLVIASADKFGKDGKLNLDEKKLPKGKKKDDPEAYGMVVIEVKKLMNGDPNLNVAINPGDRILVPARGVERAPGRPGTSFFDRILGLGRMFLFPFGGGYGGYGGGYGY